MTVGDVVVVYVLCCSWLCAWERDCFTVDSSCCAELSCAWLFASWFWVELSWLFSKLTWFCSSCICSRVAYEVHPLAAVSISTIIISNTKINRSGIDHLL